jgi:hypothetical protein
MATVYALSDGEYVAYDTTSQLYGLLAALPVGRAPVFIPATDPAVIAYQAAQTAATNASVSENAARLAGAQALYNHTQNGLTAAMCKALFGVNIVP